jgi:hypothetical protein
VAQILLIGLSEQLLTAYLSASKRTILGSIIIILTGVNGQNAQYQ